jgi:hypothetical protein
VKRRTDVRGGGIAFGMQHAIRALKLHPIEVLRYE